MMKYISREARKQTYQELFSRIIYTLIIIGVFLIGQNIPLLGVQLDDHLNSILPSGSFFALGMTPWMTTLILWRIVYMGDRARYRLVSQQKDHVLRSMLLFLIASLQAVGMLVQLDALKILPITSYRSTTFLTNLCILITGAFLTMWLAQLIMQKGLGGNSILVAITIMQSYWPNFSMFFSKNFHSGWGGFTILILGLLIFIWVIVYLFNSEYHIPYYQVNHAKRLDQFSYLPIRLIPALGLPFMYAISLFTFTKYIGILLAVLFHNQTLMHMSDNIDIYSATGNLFLLVLIFVISIGFAFFNVDTQKLADDMEKGGDFIENVNTGRATQRYLNRHLLVLAVVGAAISVLITVVPMLLNNIFHMLNAARIGTLGGALLMLMSIYVQGIDQWNAIKQKYQYTLNNL